MSTRKVHHPHFLSRRNRDYNIGRVFAHRGKCHESCDYCDAYAAWGGGGRAGVLPARHALRLLHDRQRSPVLRLSLTRFKKSVQDGHSAVLDVFISRPQPIVNKAGRIRLKRVYIENVGRFAAIHQRDPL